MNILATPTMLLLLVAVLPAASAFVPASQRPALFLQNHRHLSLNMVVTGARGKPALSAEEDLDLLTKVIMKHVDADVEEDELPEESTPVINENKVVEPLMQVEEYMEEEPAQNVVVPPNSDVDAEISHETTATTTSPTAMAATVDEAQKEEKVQVGSKEYYSGFVNRQMNEEPLERVSGDNLLMPIMKFAGSSSLVIGGFLLVFLASNGLLFSQ